MSAQPGRAAATFDASALAQAVDSLGEALGALAEHERQTRVAARAAIREKARTGRLKPHLGVAGATAPVSAPKIQMPATAPLPDLEEVERLAASAIADASGKAPA